MLPARRSNDVISPPLQVKSSLVAIPGGDAGQVVCPFCTINTLKPVNQTFTASLDIMVLFLSRSHALRTFTLKLH